MQQTTDAILKDTLYTERLPNGLSVMVLRKPGFTTVTGRVAVQYGSIDSTFIDPGTGQLVAVPEGIAHFLEHKLFEEEWGNVSDRFSEMGAESNAYTTYSHTSYYFETTQNFAECMSLLLDFVQTPHFTDESVAKEQGIIDQEIRMYLDDPGWRAQMMMMEALYVEHPVRLDIAGTVESIKRIDKETLYLCHQTFYHPSNMVVFVAGDVDPHEVVRMAADSFGRHQYKPQAEIKRVLPEEPRHVKERRRSEQLVVSQPMFRLGFKETPLGQGGRPLLERDLLTTLVLDALIGRGSDLYNELYEEGLIDQRFGFEHSQEPTYGYTFFAGPTPDPDALEKRLLAGIAQAREQGLPKADFDRAKKKALGRTIATMNHLDSIAYITMDGYFKDVSLFDLLPVAQSLTVEAANQRLREHLDPEQAVVTLITPK